MAHLKMAAALLAAVAPAPLAQAQTADIVVTGAGLPRGASDPAYDSVVIDRERLSGSASGRLEDVLRDAAGFQQFRRSDARSAHPTSQGASLRGLGGNASSRALILLDGVPQIDPFGGWVSWSAYEPLRLGQVRVTRGGGSGVNGPGALAGTIELTSAGPDQVAPLWGGVAYGSRNSVDADIGALGALGGGFGSLAASYARGDGFVPIVRGDRGPADIAARYEQASLAGRAVIPVGGDTELQAATLLMLDRRTRGVAFTPNRNLGADASLRLVGHGSWQWEASTWLQMREFSSGFSRVDDARATSLPTLDQYNVPATGTGAHFEVRPPLGDGIELRLGGDGRQTMGRTKEHFTFTGLQPTRDRQAGGRTRTIGAFAETTVSPSSALTLTGGARLDRWWIDKGFLAIRSIPAGALLTDNSFADRSGWRPTGRLGIAFKPVGAVTMRAAGYLGWRLPTLNELYRPFRVGNDTTNANAALNPERLKGVDAGIDYYPLSGVHFGATVFYNRLDDAIANVTQSVTPAGTTRMRDNLDAIRSRGVDMDADLTLDQWRMALSYSYVDARVKASGMALPLNGLRPAQTPRHQASATLGWEQPGLVNVSGTIRYIGRQFEDDQNTRTLRDAVTVDAALAVPLAGGLSLELRGENLANAQVDAGVSATGVVERATPRTLWLGLRYGRGSR